MDFLLVNEEVCCKARLYVGLVHTTPEKIITRSFITSTVKPAVHTNQLRKWSF